MSRCVKKPAYSADEAFRFQFEQHAYPTVEVFLAVGRLLSPPGMASASYTIDREPTLDKSGDISGPRIRCPLCGWSPRKHGQWFCTCDHYWNTFGTGGVCPDGLPQWMKTQCLACTRWSAHSDWYAE